MSAQTTIGDLPVIACGNCRMVHAYQREVLEGEYGFNVMVPVLPPVLEERHRWRCASEDGEYRRFPLPKRTPCRSLERPDRAHWPSNKHRQQYRHHPPRPPERPLMAFTDKPRST